NGAEHLCVIAERENFVVARQKTSDLKFGAALFQLGSELVREVEWHVSARVLDCIMLCKEVRISDVPGKARPCCAEVFLPPKSRTWRCKCYSGHYCLFF